MANKKTPPRKSRKPAKPRAPSHLSEKSRTFWTKTRADYAITDEAGLRVLTACCECLDTAEAARAAIAKHGQTYNDRFGAPRSRPEVAIQRNALVTFGRLIRTLGLDVEQEPYGG